ncbi:RNA pseudouridine synthase [Flavobacteriaceae bacterium D16]|nr:RNA pseudouridine synthase [Flavobacteriaceae bacterium D16]
MAKILSNDRNLQVLYEDNHLIAVNKRPGDIIQGDKTGDKPLSEIVKDYIKKKYKKPGNVYLGVAHRLDRPTSGVVVFARTSKALARLNKLFAGKETEKTYWAIIKDRPPKEADSLTHWLKKNPKQNKSYPHTKEIPGSKKAILDYRLIKTLDRYSLLEINLHTGRHHQIRAQLTAIGCPIKGDLKYGYDRSNPDGSIHLHARSLKFVHPVKKELLAIEASPPQSLLWDLCLSD